MKEIECPSCEAMIPDDSKYCDQCGVELLECLKCGALGTDSFCSECGGAMVSRKTRRASGDKDENSTLKGRDESENPYNPDNGGKTIGGRRKCIMLKARNGGIMLKPSHEAIIGRSGGDFDSQLGALNLISRRHGKFIQRGRDWYIVDFGSTNGTYVNDTELQPNQPMKFKVGDVVDIGTYLFDVIEQ